MPASPIPKKKPKNPWSAGFLGWRSRGSLADRPQANYSHKPVKPAIPDSAIRRIRNDLAAGR